MATSTYMTFLMHKDKTAESADEWKKLIDITEFPDLGGEPEMLDTTTLSDKMRTYIPGIQDLEGMTFAANYDHEKYLALKALENKEQDYAVWFGGTEKTGVLPPTPTGSEGKFSFSGQLSVYVTGGAVDKAGKAVKDFTLGIDELNILNANSGSGSGGGASFGDIFEEVEVPSEIADWAARIREAIEAGDWRSVGTILADKLNEVVDSWDSYAWGAKLGGLINNGLNVAYGFLTEFDFTALGVKVGEAFTGILDTVDFDLVGRTFAAKWNALFDFLYGVVTTIPWGELGLHIAEIVNGFVDELHWDVIGQTISEGLTGIFTAAKTAIQNIHWGEIGSGLAEILNNIDWYGII